MYIIVSVIIIIALLILSYLPKLEKFRTEHDDFYNFILTMAATFIGVALAIDLTNLDAERKDRDNVVRLIELADLNLKQSFDNVTTKRAFIDNKILDNNDAEKDSAALEQYFIINNGFPPPSLFYQTLENELVLKHISKRGLRELYMARQNLEKQNDTVLKSKTDVEKKMLFVKTYHEQLAFIHKGLLTEIEYVEGNFNNKEIEQLYHQFGLELMGVTDEQINKALEKIGK